MINVNKSKLFATSQFVQLKIAILRLQCISGQQDVKLHSSLFTRNTSHNFQHTSFTKCFLFKQFALKLKEVTLHFIAHFSPFLPSLHFSLPCPLLFFSPYHLGGIHTKPDFHLNSAE